MNINPFDILKNAQKIQEQMGNLQEKMANISAAGSSGGGMVEVSLNGKMEIMAVRISPEAMEDRDMLQDLIAAAFTAAMEKVREKINSELGTMTGGLGIPGFPGFGMTGQP
jgi:DNA-binding YbaB/EbfC family protein